MSNATPLLRAELNLFSKRHRLTAREHDVMFLLATGCSTVPVIAERLSLSQNTIHNHFKNIFRRTRTNSKAGLLALLLNETLARQAAIEPFVRRPRVLLVEPDDSERVRTIEALEERGVQTAWELQPDRVLERLREQRIDAVVIDAALAEGGQRELLPRILDHFGKHPVVVIASGDAEADRETWKARGASELFTKPLGIDRMLFAILEHNVESPYERSRLVRVDTDLPARIDGTLKGAIGNLAFGGAFITLPEEALREGSALTVESDVRVSFDLEDREPLDLRGQVRWRRDASRPASEAGIGVQFVDCAASERDAIEDYVRRRKLGAIDTPSMAAR